MIFAAKIAGRNGFERGKRKVFLLAFGKKNPGKTQAPAGIRKQGKIGGTYFV